MAFALAARDGSRRDAANTTGIDAFFAEESRVGRTTGNPDPILCRRHSGQ
jgi:hypothetical protein